MVIDNHSSDNTYLTAVGLKESHGLYNMQVIRNPRNEGYGGSPKKLPTSALSIGDLKALRCCMVMRNMPRN